jgi:ADP-L-glycero-D-manno-heptose 6-epimerase
MNPQWCVVTGGAGFVGGRLVRALNEAGYERIVVVDSFTRRPHKLTGISGARFSDFLDYFALDTLDVDALDRQLPALEVIFHVGAWSDVLETDVTKMLRYNFGHARKWLELGQRRGVPVIYASTSALYGTSRLCRVNDHTCERPFNAYGHSKLVLDRWVLASLDRFTSPAVGFRFFNVFGQGEEHKAHNSSIPTRFFEFVRAQGHIDLFEGDIRRDYVHVDDVARIMIQAWQTHQASGVYNLGSGVAISHREIAEKVVATARDAGLRLEPEPIRLVPIPATLRDRFQFYTQAVGVLPWVADVTAHPLEKMGHYWIELVKSLGDTRDAREGRSR